MSCSGGNLGVEGAAESLRKEEEEGRELDSGNITPFSSFSSTQ